MGQSEISRRNLGISIIIGLLLVIASFVLSHTAFDFTRFSSLGYAGIFIATLLGSATLFFPVPNIAVVIAGGVFLNPIGVALASGFGSALGEMVGYFVGRGGGTVIKDSKYEPIIRKWIKSYGGFAIFGLAFIPNPFFDLAGLGAGMVNYPLPWFFLATLIGKTLRSLALAYLGWIIK
jgi:membrane protein DedA with SNARE-associated domain